MADKPTCEELEQRVKELEEESINLKLIEKELHDKDKHLQSILESADGFAIYRLIVDKEDPYILRTTFVSPSIRDVLGCEPENFSSATFFSNIHPDDLTRVEQAHKQAFETHRFDEICRYYNSIKKQWIWIHAISTGVVNDEGHISHVNGIFVDITEQKKAEESLRRSEEHLRSLMESATNFAVYRLISDETNPHRLKVKFVSPSVKDILGIPEPMKFEIWFENMHPDDVERITEANQRAFKTLRFDEEYRTYHRKKGEWRWIHAISTGGVDKKGWNRYVNGILLDITDYKQVEEALTERTRELELKTQSLEELNIALKVLLKKREEDKIEIEENVMTNVKKLIAPYFEKIKKTKLDDQQGTFVNILESNLNEIVSPFTRKLSLKYLSLTPKEITIVNMIRQGYTTKKIANLMNISPRTVDTHRKNIRRKIGLGKKRANLRSHLLAYEQ